MRLRNMNECITSPLSPTGVRAVGLCAWLQAPVVAHKTAITYTAAEVSVMLTKNERSHKLKD